MIKIFKFRTNDLHPSAGKQIEFNTAIVKNFFEFTKEEVNIVCHCIDANGQELQVVKSLLRLSPARGDYKVYQNEDGSPNIKDFFLDTLHLTVEKNIDDYFALRKRGGDDYDLFYIPALLSVNEVYARLSLHKNCMDVVVDDESQSESIFDKKDNLLLQQIYYGAPGTGKSHEIKEQTAEAEKQGRVFRTTFHPDSDYSTFVGCYKPTISQKAVRNVVGDVVKRDGKEVFEDYISYQFVPQAFTNAYVKAWQTNEPVFLIIEEINRGNCAQIFGDLFQLLDRGDDGVSDYPIKADTDLCQYLEKELGEDGSKGIKDGKLCLPANLHIWATMNTSDQSLFPIDSAFKRRWDWHYTPICNANKGWKVEANGNQYDWWDFLQKINGRIERATSSEDKQLGYFFCKADGDGVISAEKFVSKVIFYLWNDVFKDFADSSDDPFKVADGNRMTFRSFYIADENGKTIVNEDNVEALLKNIGCEFSEDTSSSFIVKYKGQIIGGSARNKYIETISRVVEEKGADLVADCLGADFTQTPTAVTRNYKLINDTGWFLATNNGVEAIKSKLQKLKDKLGVDIDVE